MPPGRASSTPILGFVFANIIESSVSNDDENTKKRLIVDTRTNDASAVNERENSASASAPNQPNTSSHARTSPCVTCQRHCTAFGQPLLSQNKTNTIDETIDRPFAKLTNANNDAAKSTAKNEFERSRFLSESTTNKHQQVRLTSATCVDGNDSRLFAAAFLAVYAFATDQIIIIII